MADDDKLKVGVELEVENVNIKSDKIKKSLKDFNKEVASLYNVIPQNIFNAKTAKASYHSFYKVIDPFFEKASKGIFTELSKKMVFSRKGLGPLFEQAYNQEQIRQRVLGNIKQYGAGSKSLQSRTQKAFGHLGFLSQSLLGNNYEARLRSEAISNYVALSNATAPIKNQNITKGLLTQDYINQSLGINKSPELAKLSRFYSEQEKNTKSKLQSILQESSYSGLGSKYESQAIKNIKKQDIFEEKQRQKESKELLKKQKEEEKQRQKEFKQKEKHNQELYKSSLGVIKGIAGAVTGTLAIGSILGHRYNRWANEASSNINKYEKYEGYYGTGNFQKLQTYEKFFSKYGGVSKEQTRAMFGNLSQMFTRMQMFPQSSEYTQKLLNILRLNELPQNEFQFFNAIMERIPQLSKKQIGVMAQDYGIDAGVLTALRKSAVRADVKSDWFNLQETNITTNEANNLSRLGEASRGLANTFTDFKAIFVSHNNEFVKLLDSTNEVLRKTDIAIIVIDINDKDMSIENDLIKALVDKKIPYIIAYNKIDTIDISKIDKKDDFRDNITNFITDKFTFIFYKFLSV